MRSIIEINHRDADSPDDLQAIYDHRGWQKCLEEYCEDLKGHRVVWREDAEPHRVKLVHSARR